jgi:3-oxoacyl-[acyl-carrier protein] reductase
MLSLSKLYADRCAADGVLVNAVCPGPTKSELWMSEGGLAEQSAQLSGLKGRDEALERAGEGRPIGRLAEVDEIAAAIVFLCSDRASYVAGAAWSIDGGTVPIII